LQHTPTEQLQQQNKQLADNLASTQAKLKAALDELDKLKARLEDMVPK
jgi:hypothetical protein